MTESPPAPNVSREQPSTGARRGSTHRKIVVRVLLLGVTGVSLYLLAPSLLEVFSSWTQLRTLNPYWIIPAVLFEAASFVSLWALQRIALRTKSWFAVGTSQLSANAAGSVIPGGGAAATAVQYGILVQAGVPSANVASGLAASWAATTAAVFAIPVVGAIAAIFGTGAPRACVTSPTWGRARSSCSRPVPWPLSPGTSRSGSSAASAAKSPAGSVEATASPTYRSG